MRSGGVVGKVQKKVPCNRLPVPTRYPQPLSQGLSALPAPLTQGSQALRGTGLPSAGAKERGHPCGLFFPAPCFSFPFAGNHKIQHFSVDLPEKSTYNQVVKTIAFPEGGAI